MKSSYILSTRMYASDAKVQIEKRCSAKQQAQKYGITTLLIGKINFK